VDFVFAPEGGRISINPVTSRSLGHLEVAVAEQGDHLAWRQVEFDRVLAGPFHPVHAEERPQKLVARRDRLVVGAAEDREDRVDQEDELVAGAQEARRLGDPGVGLAPDARCVLGDRDVDRPTFDSGTEKMPQAGSSPS
jgi:hypothetical protein